VGMIELEEEERKVVEKELEIRAPIWIWTYEIHDSFNKWSELRDWISFMN
jgi:hypothetical protein